MGRKRKANDDEDQYDLPSSHLSISHIAKQEKRLIIVLENAQLESVKVIFALNSSIEICRLYFTFVCFIIGW